METTYLVVRVQPREDFDPDGENPLSIIMDEIVASLDEIRVDAEIMEISDTDPGAKE